MTEQRMVDVELIRSAVEMLEEDLPYMNISLAPKELPVVQLIDKLRAIIASHNVGWQPIETAPRDGTTVDLWHKEGFRCTETWWDAEDACWSCVDTDSSFTNWMPLPQPPKED